MFRDPQLRSGRVLRFGLASLGQLVGSVAEELINSMLVMRSSCRCGPLGIDLRLVCSALNACFNVDARASPAHSGCIYVPATWSVGFKSVGGRALAWRAMPSMPRVNLL